MATDRKYEDYSPALKRGATLEANDIGDGTVTTAKIAADAFGLKLKGSKPWKERDESILNMEDPANPVAEMGPWSYPVSKDYRVHKNGKTEYFSDITVYAPASGKVYLPRR